MSIVIHFGWLKTERENQPIEKDNMKHFIYYSQIYSWNKSTPGGNLNIIPLELL